MKSFSRKELIEFISNNTPIEINDTIVLDVKYEGNMLKFFIIKDVLDTLNTVLSPLNYIKIAKWLIFGTGYKELITKWIDADKILGKEESIYLL